MADNVPITPGTGVDIATDDVGGVQYQRVKLDIGGDGSSVPVTDLAAHSQSSAATASWTSATAQDTDVQLDVTKYASVGLRIALSSGSITGGTAIFEATQDGTNWERCGGLGSRGYNRQSTSLQQYLGIYERILTDLTVSTMELITFGVGGYTKFRVRLNPVISGTATLSVSIVGDTAPAPNSLVPMAGLDGNGRVIVAGQSTAGSSTTTINPLLAGGSDGGNLLRGIRTDANGELQIDVLTLPTATVTGTVAHDGTDSGNPQKIGVRAETDLAASTMVSDGDRTDLYGDIDGVLLTKPMCPFNNILVERVTDTGGTSTASTVFGATASARNMITSFVVFNDSTTNGFIDFRDGTAGTVLLTLPLPAKGGAVFSPPLPFRQTTVNTALAYDVSAALTTVYISLIGFKSKA